MSKLDQILKTRQDFMNYSYRELDEAAYTLSEPMTKQSLRQYLLIKDSCSSYLQMDIMDEKHKRKSEEDYEQMRLDALKRIESEPSTQKQLEILVSTAKELKEAAFFLNYNTIIQKCFEVPFAISVATNMFKAGYGLTDVKIALFPNECMSEVYCVSKHLGFDITPTEKEQKIMDEEARKKDEEDEQYPPNSMAALLKGKTPNDAED